MRKHLALVALVATAPTIAVAQGATQDLIDRGVRAYEAFQVEQARPLFQQVISPSWLSPVNADQRVTAYKYLGASYAVLAITDSATLFFRSALDFDPFTDLDPTKFSESELGPFNVAKSQIFRVGLKPILPQVVDPAIAESFYRFQLVTTHRSQMTVTLIRQQPDTSVKEVLFDGQNDGPRDIRWDGFLRNAGRIADSSTYMLRVTAASALLSTGGTGAAGRQTETQTQFFRVEQSYSPLEDTLPSLPASMLLPSNIPGSAPWIDLIKGFAVGALAYGIPVALLNDDVKWQMHAIVGAGVGILSGVGSFLYRRHDPSIPENVAENARRQAQRQRFNDGVRSRNNAKLQVRKIVITPLTGVGR